MKTGKVTREIELHFVVLNEDQLIELYEDRQKSLTLFGSNYSVMKEKVFNPKAKNSWQSEIVLRGNGSIIKAGGVILSNGESFQSEEEMLKKYKPVKQEKK